MTLLNYCKLDKDYLDFATEKSKLKIGKFTPGGNIPIFSDFKILKEMPDYALILAWNFAKEIISNNKEYLKKGGKFIIPIPKVKNNQKMKKISTKINHRDKRGVIRDLIEKEKFHQLLILLFQRIVSEAIIFIKKPYNGIL